MFSRVSRLVIPENTNRYYSAEEVLIRILSEGEQSTTWWHSHSSRRMPASKSLPITYASGHPKAYRQPRRLDLECSGGPYGEVEEGRRGGHAAKDSPGCYGSTDAEQSWGVVVLDRPVVEGMRRVSGPLHSRC